MKTQNYKTAQIALFFVTFFFSTSSHASFEFSPITMALTTQGRTSHAIATVINRETVAVPIVIRVTERILLENGEENRPETTDIAVYPSQFLLDPKETKSIKVTWQGSEKLPNEKAYRIIVEEVPIDFSAKSSNKGAVNILINYVGSVYVNSDKTEGDLTLENIEITADQTFLVLSFANKGTAHSILKSPVIEINGKTKADSEGKSEEKKVTLDKNILSNVVGKNILALSKIKFKIPKPVELVGVEKIDWKFSYDK